MRGTEFRSGQENPYPVIAGGALKPYWELVVDVPGRGSVAVENKMTPELWDASLGIVIKKAQEIGTQVDKTDLTEDTQIIEDLGLKSVHRQDLIVRLKQGWRASGHRIVPPVGLVRTIRTLGHIAEVVNLTETGDEALANQYRLNRMQELEAQGETVNPNVYPEVEFE